MNKNKKHDNSKNAVDRTRKARTVSTPAHADAVRPARVSSAPYGPPGTTGERLYSAEELATKYGMTTEEVMAIAVKLGVVGDPRFGQWVATETAREKKPLS